MADSEKQKIIDLALAADRLRTEPAFQQAILSMRRDAVEALVAANPTDADTIRMHQANIRAIDNLCGELAWMITHAASRQGPAVA